MELENSWKLAIGITLGVCMLIFGAVFWNSATEDYYNPLNEVTYEINSCLVEHTSISGGRRVGMNARMHRQVSM